MRKTLYRGEYRGKRFDNEEWVYGDLTKFGRDKSCIVSRTIRGKGKSLRENLSIEYYVLPNTVCKYTGRKDYMGLPIYAGDIIRTIDERRIGTVRFGKPKYTVDDNKYKIGVYINWVTDNPSPSEDIDYWLNEEGIEVIGNIYDNPNLLLK